MKKLTQQEANDLVVEAWRLVKEYESAKYRFGQALYNLLPEELYKHYHMTAYDFFYWSNSDQVLESFYKYFVE